MNRDIKFRGISERTNGFVYGSLFFADTGLTIIENGGSDITDFHFVKPESVGQYTGIKFNDVELYEGDIIEWYQRPEGYPQDPQKVRKTKVIELSNLIAGCFLYNFYDYKIIGNIHQDKDLL